MQSLSSRLAAVSVAGLTVLSGCQTCRQSAYPPPASPIAHPAATLPPGVGPRIPIMSGPPPGAVLVPPGQIQPAQPRPIAPTTGPYAMPVAPPPQPAPVTPVETRGYASAGEDVWRPAPGSVRLAPPESVAANVGDTPAPLPQTPAPLPQTPAPMSQMPPAQDVAPTPQQRQATKPADAPETRLRPVPLNVPAPAAAQNPSSTTPSLPVGIPQFVTVKPGVAAGLRPSADDGIDWLAARGYRTVLHVRAAGEDDNADRKEVERRGLRFLSIDVTPSTLGRAQVDEFNRAVADVGGQPLFVYDRDGSLAGAFWYLHFRTVDRQPDDAARAQAGRLGLRTDPAGEGRDLWAAVQKYLGDNPP